jgi:hypothetical protein
MTTVNNDDVGYDPVSAGADKHQFGAVDVQITIGFTGRSFTTTDP